MATKTLARPDVAELTAAAGELRRLVERLDAIDVPGLILDQLAALAADLDDIVFERERGRARWCRCPGHNGEYARHVADEQRRVAELRRQEAERERQRLEAEGRDQSRAGWV
jgi:hypothetical protein